MHISWSWIKGVTSAGNQEIVNASGGSLLKKSPQNFVKLYFKVISYFVIRNTKI
jgi:hypothetical protein